MLSLKNENQAGMQATNFHKILVANRGEIALRVIRAIRDLDKLAVVIHSDFDRDLPFVTEADEAYSLGDGTLADTYLNEDKILEIALSAQVDAIHPGYGFLSENPNFARACREKGISFIGPEAGVISLMGHKSNARRKAADLGIPVLDGVISDLEGLIGQKASLPYPLLIKPAGGGGGKGMRIVTHPSSFEEQARDATREALSYFGNGDLYVERFLENPRHIEVQVIADHHGNAAHLFERECSLQRRYQKIIEEAPSGFLKPETRERITRIALQLVRGISYTNAGTIEFLMDEQQEFFFLEMNTRIQVEHPVTEMVTRIDLVREQIRIAEGKPLSFRQDEVELRGHAIEARIYAENPEQDFMPSTGRIDTFEWPQQPSVRVDNGFQAGNLVEPYYDPMLAKLITTGRNREEARNLAISALKEVRVTGLTTNRDFLIELLRSESFNSNQIHTRYIDNHLGSLLSHIQERRKNLEKNQLLAAASLIALQKSNGPDQSASPWLSIGHWRILPDITLLCDHRPYRIRYELIKGRERVRLHMDQQEFLVSLERREGNHYWIRMNRQILRIWGVTDRSEVLLDLDGHLFRLRRMDILDRRFISSSATRRKEDNGEVFAPLNGRIVQINVKEGDQVEEGDPLLVIESMKMENKILASYTSRVGQIAVSVGDQVKENQLIITLAI